MSAKETERISIMESLKAKRIKQHEAAKVLGISTRQVRRVFTRYKAERAVGLIHKSRGKISNRAIDEKEKDYAIDLVKRYYPDFGPTFAHEKLTENHGVAFSVDTLKRAR
jgi:transposase